MMMTLLMGQVDCEMVWAIKEPMKLPNCMQALNKHITMYSAAGGKSSKRICIITLMRENAMLMKNTPIKPSRKSNKHDKANTTASKVYKVLRPM